jgi:hypothetical protein
MYTGILITASSSRLIIQIFSGVSPGQLANLAVRNGALTGLRLSEVHPNDDRDIVGLGGIFHPQSGLPD